MKLTTHIHVMPRLRRCGALHPLPSPPQAFIAWLLIMNRDNFTFSDVLERCNTAVFDPSACSDLEAALGEGKWIVAPSAGDETVHVY
jgi:hypothetical protein